MVTIQEKGCNAITFLPNKKGNLILHELPLVKDYANIKQFIEHPLRLNYPNHTQAVELEVKLTTAASGRIAGKKRLMGEALCSTIAGRKKTMGWKKLLCYQKGCKPINALMAILA